MNLVELVNARTEQTLTVQANALYKKQKETVGLSTVFCKRVESGKKKALAKDHYRF